MKQNPNKNVMIKIKLKPEQLDLIEQAAKNLGLSRSEFVLKSSCLEAESIMTDRVEIHEENEDSFKSW